MIRVKVNANLQAILTYLQTYEYHCDLMDLVKWCIDFDYYKELYENFHIINILLNEHNKKYVQIDPSSFTGNLSKGSDYVSDDEDLL